MREISLVWHPMREHLGIYGHLTRVESPNESGIPDVAYTLLGCSGWIENKIFEDREDRCPRHLTRAQVDWAQAEVRPPARGRWFLFGRNRLVWLLYDVIGASKLLEGEGSFPIFRIGNRFPIGEILPHLAPPEARRQKLL